MAERVGRQRELVSRSLPVFRQGFLGAGMLREDHRRRGKGHGSVLLGQEPMVCWASLGRGMMMLTAKDKSRLREEYLSGQRGRERRLPGRPSPRSTNPIHARNRAKDTVEPALLRGFEAEGLQ